MTKEQVADNIRRIKAEFRQGMNGVASAKMRELGAQYKVNFGIEYPRLQMIAQSFEKDHDLAQALWKDNIRECRIIAAMLQPVETFDRDFADLWIETIDNVEIAQYTSMNLFQHLPFASEIAFNWMADEREMYQVCGFSIATRLIMRNVAFNGEAQNELIDQALTAMQDKYPSVQKAAFSCLLKFVSSGADEAAKVKNTFASLQLPQNQYGEQCRILIGEADAILETKK